MTNSLYSNLIYKFFLNIILIVFSIFSLFFYCDKAYASEKAPLTRAGDMLQIINPIVAGYTASQEKGVGHFGIVYGQALGIMFATKFVGMQSEWEVSKRPSNLKGKMRFDGFPSGHTTSAWSAASYVRVFSEDYKALAIPLYATAAITGYSRVKAKAHTKTQVFMAIALSEAVNEINSRLDWSNEYRSTSISFSPDGILASIKIKF